MKQTFHVIHSSTLLTTASSSNNLWSSMMTTKCLRNNVQGLVLLSFLLVVCLTSPGCTYGETIKPSNMMTKVSHVTRPPCYKDNQGLGQFCCKIDKLCWTNLSECFINCPCKINCKRAATTTQ
ncbi:hypothetical protein ZWY2020_036088 [Hordeum vulgare]|uniref:Uncharacterized protein n=1 Tax=Hordeum vulgare subsp. vulgare TaxID=112509 RepID=A0A8I6Y3R1_HORVV|nr:hypothetical protein ZWY2020_036088 [Hordeum vulgare]